MKHKLKDEQLMQILKMFIPQTEFNITKIKPANMDELKNVDWTKYTGDVGRLSKITEIQLSLLLLVADYIWATRDTTRVKGMCQ